MYISRRACGTLEEDVYNLLRHRQNFTWKNALGKNTRKMHLEKTRGKMHLQLLTKKEPVSKRPANPRTSFARAFPARTSAVRWMFPVFDVESRRKMLRCENAAV